MAAINFYAGENFSIANLSGSGLGFYGGGFGFSVAVGEYQDSTFITDGNGTSQGPQVDNIKYMNTQSGIVNGASSGVNIFSPLAKSQSGQLGMATGPVTNRLVSSLIVNMVLLISVIDQPPKNKFSIKINYLVIYF